MKITDFTREEVEAMVNSGLMNKKSLKHYDICKAIALGKTASAIGDEFGITETRLIHHIKNVKCKECR